MILTQGLSKERDVIFDVLENCPLDCLAEKNAPSPEIQRRVLKREFNQLFYKLKKEGAQKFPYESLPMDFRWNLCATRLRMGHFDNWDGWQFRGNFATTFYLKSFNTPKWMGQPIQTEHGLKVCGEQGVGDEILFMSAFPDLMVRTGPKALEIYCHPRLVPIFERSFRVKASNRPPGLSDIDGESMLLMGELLKWYRCDGRFPKKPYLKPDPLKVAYWQEWLAQFPGKHIGFAYKARHGNFKRDEIWGLISGQGALFDLQYDEPSHDSPPFDVKEDLENLFAFVKALDKVVTVTQTLAHVAGSVGTECHAIIPERGTGEVNNRLWYYSHGDTYWPHVVYPNVTVYKNVDEFRNRI